MIPKPVRARKHRRAPPRKPGSLPGAALTPKLSHKAVLFVFGAMLCATGCNIVLFSRTL